MTLLIKNVQILGGKQKFSDKSDVFISNGKIIAIGKFPEKKADEVVDGRGNYLCPGFIDVNTDSDHYLSIFTNPSQADFLKQGITTIVGGLCGASLAPLLYGSLKSIESWADTQQANVNWHSTAEFLKTLSQKKLGVNFVTLTGHSTIREAIIGEPSRSLTKNELVVFGETLKRSLREGSFGLSSGLSYAEGRDTPYQELKFLVSIVEKFNGVYATHLRNTELKLIESIDETIKISEETGAKTLISHFLPIREGGGKYEKAIIRINDLPKSSDFNFDIYPFDEKVLALYTFLPTWAQRDNIRVMAMALKDEWLKPKIIADLPSLDSKNLIIARAVKNNSIVGYSLKDFRDLYSIKNNREALYKLMETTGLQATVFYKNIDLNLVREAIKSPRSFIATNAASFEENSSEKILKPKRATSTFTEFLRLVQEDKIMSLDDAISKITEQPAQKFDLQNRGRVAEGFFADLVCFRSNEIKFVIVNGILAVHDGKLKNTSAGRVFKH